VEHDEAQAPAPARSQYPALSISKPPPRRERVMTYVVSGLFAGALALALSGMVAHWLHAP
jgi:hypothetical protein